MVTPKCPKCERTNFEIQELQAVAGAQVALYAVLCRSYGAIVGVVKD